MNSIRFIPFLPIILLAVLSFKCSNKHKASNIEESLYWDNSSPGDEGIDPAVMDSIDHDIVTGKYGLIDHLLLIRNGKLVFNKKYEQDYKTISQQYDTANNQFNYDHPAWHPYYNYTELHTLQSVTKSVTSILVGIAIDEGLISSVDAPVLPLFSEYEIDTTDELKKAITLRNLLTMQSGIKWHEGLYDASDDCILMELSDDWIQYVLDKQMDTIPGVAFNYNSGVSVLIGKIVGTSVGKRVDKWAEEKLFGPLGITEYYWKRTPSGEIDTEGGLYLSALDLAKIGYMMLNQGKWESRQIVSKEWVEESIRPVVSRTNRRNATIGYGYQWWVPKPNEGKAEIFAGQGYGGQYMMISPEYNLLLVVNGWNIHSEPAKASYWLMQERIIPNIKVE